MPREQTRKLGPNCAPPVPLAGRWCRGQPLANEHTCLVPKKDSPHRRFCNRCTAFGKGALRCLDGRSTAARRSSRSLRRGPAAAEYWRYPPVRCGSSGWRHPHPASHAPVRPLAARHVRGVLAALAAQCLALRCCRPGLLLDLVRHAWPLEEAALASESCLLLEALEEERVEL